MLGRKTTERAAKKIFYYVRMILLVSYRYALRRPRQTLFFFILTTLISLVLASQTRILLLIDEMVDPEFSTYSELNHLNRYFPEKNSAILIVRPKLESNTLSKQALCDVRRWVQELAEKQENLIDVTTSFGVRTFEFQSNELKLNPLLTIDCGKLSDPETQSLQTGLEKVKNSPWGMVLTSNQHNDIAMQFRFLDTEKNSFWLYPNDEKKFKSETVIELIDSFKNKVEVTHPEIKAVWGGVATFQGFYKLAFDQANILNLMSILIVLALMRFLFGTFRSGFLYIISFIAAAVPVFGGMALFKAPVDVLSNSIGLMILIASLEDFMFAALYLQKNKGPWKRGFRKFLIPGFFTTLTTFVGFGSLAIADLDILRRFGIWAATGSLLQFVTVFYLIPAIMDQFPYFQDSFKKPSPDWRWIKKFSEFRLPKLLGHLTGIIFILSLLFLNRIVVSDAPTNIFSYEHPTNESSRELLKIRGWQTALSLVFKDPSAVEFNKKIVDELKQQPAVIGIENLYDIDSYLKKGIPETYLSTIDLLWSQSEGHRRLSSDETQEERAIVYISTQDIENTHRLYTWAKEKCQGKCFLAGSLVSYSEFGQRVLTTLMSSLFTSLILVSLILVFLCLAKDVPDIYPVIFSAIWGPLSMIFYFVAFKVPIFYITSMFASILIGLAGDNSIQFIFSKARGSPLDGVKSVGSFSILIVLSMCATSTVMFLSEFAALQKLGVLMIFGFLLMLFGDIAILRSLAPRLEKDN